MSNSKLRLRVELDRTTAQYIGLSYLDINIQQTSVKTTVAGVTTVLSLYIKDNKENIIYFSDINAVNIAFRIVIWFENYIQIIVSIVNLVSALPAKGYLKRMSNFRVSANCLCETVSVNTPTYYMIICSYCMIKGNQLICSPLEHSDLSRICCT